MVPKLNSSSSETPGKLFKTVDSGSLPSLLSQNLLEMSLCICIFFKALPLIAIMHLILKPTVTWPLIKMLYYKQYGHLGAMCRERNDWLSTYPELVLELG